MIMYCSTWCNNFTGFSCRVRGKASFRCYTTALQSAKVLRFAAQVCNLQQTCLCFPFIAAQTFAWCDQKCTNHWPNCRALLVWSSVAAQIQMHLSLFTSAIWKHLHWRHGRWRLSQLQHDTRRFSCLKKDAFFVWFTCVWILLSGLFWNFLWRSNKLIDFVCRVFTTYMCIET